MLRFPKKNIAQRGFDRKKAATGHYKLQEKQLPATEKPKKVIKEEEPQSTEYLDAVWAGKLYPHELWNMHCDIDKFAYQKLSVEELSVIKRKLSLAWLDWKDDIENPKIPPPFSLSQVESDADKILFDFVQNSMNIIGVEAYGAMLQQAITDEARILLALRCYIAATSGKRERDSIKIYRNKQMDSWDFFPKECKRIGVDPQTGKKFTYYVDRPKKKKGDKDDLYWRSKNHQSADHYIVSKFVEPELSQKDKMPINIAPQMAEILSDFGIKVNSHEKAWNELSNRSRNASIENRIVARIAYLITNATVHKKTLGLDCRDGQKITEE